METVLVVLTLLYTSHFLEKKHHKESIGASIQFNILSNQVIKEDDVYSMLHYRIDSLDLNEYYKGRNELWFNIRNEFRYPPGRVVYEKDKGRLYLHTWGKDALYPQFFYDAVQIANYLDKEGIPYCTDRTSRKGIWTDEMLEAEEVKIIDSKKCKDG